MKIRYRLIFRIVLAIILITACTDKSQRSSHTLDAKITELKAFDHYMKSEDLLLGMPVRLKYDSDNQHLFVQDLPKWAVTEIDDSTNIINVYGRRGRGPGEIQMLNDFFFNKEHLFIVDGGQYLIHKYSRDDGKYISSLNYVESSKIIPPSPPIPLNDNNNQVFVTLNETVLIPSQFGERYLFMAVNWQGEGTVMVIEDTTGNFFPAPNSVPGNPRALPATTIFIMDPDSNRVKGLAADYSGKFELQLKPGNYIMQLRHIGYEDAFMPFQIAKEEQLQLNPEIGKIYEPEDLPFGASEAEQDIENGIVEIRQAASTFWETDDPKRIQKLEEQYSQIQKKYGFTKRDIRDEFKELYETDRNKLWQAIKRYNKVVDEHLSQINGPNWREKYWNELDEACNLILND